MAEDPCDTAVQKGERRTGEIEQAEKSHPSPRANTCHRSLKMCFTRVLVEVAAAAAAEGTAASNEPAGLSK